MTPDSPSSIYRYDFVIPESAIDENGHVNNVVYVQWMQDAAVKHFTSIGGNEPMQKAGGTWVVRSHKIEYLSAAYAGEQIEVRTWIADIRRVRSLRKYEFVCKSDGRTLVKGETDWVFIDVRSGRPVEIPAEVASIFSILENKR